MHPILLQADPVSAAFQLTNYGPIGIIIFLFISVIVYLENIRRKKDADTGKQLSDQQAKIDKLEERFDRYQNEDRTKMLAVIQQNTEVMQHNTDVMEQVVKQLQRKP